MKMKLRAGRKVFHRGSCVWVLVLCAALSWTSAYAAQQPSAHTFLVASDLHFNPMADPKLVDELNRAAPTEWETILDQSKPTAFSQYGEDTNWWLLRSALDAMRATLPHPAFILLTGDMLAHQFSSTFRQTAKDNDPESYRKFVLKTMEFLGLQLRRRFPHTAILLTPGNDDDDCGDYNIEAGGPFLRDTAELARELAKSDAQLKSSWEGLGSYDIPHPAIRNARVISLNTVFFSNKYQAEKFSEGCARVSSTAPEDLFAWLQERLSRAQQAHEKVWLMFHIPPGMDGYATIQKYQSLLKSNSHDSPSQLCAAALVPMWAPRWSAQFGELLAKYHDTVMASLAGHTHNDDFRVVNASTARPAFVLINPPISPIYNQNPGFRVATFKTDGSLGDESVYYLTNLLFASSTAAGQWNREYGFAREWKMRGVTADNLAALYGEIKANEGDRAEWLKLYNVSSSAAHLPPGSVPGLYCAIEGLDPETYGNCFCSAISPSH